MAEIVSEAENQENFELLLSDIEQAMAGRGARARGDRFEDLVRLYLQHDPVRRDQFTKVQLYADWAAEHLDLALNRRDTGIDLVATNAGDGRFTAIQCKYYAPGGGIASRHINAFLAASDNAEVFTGRYLVTTSTAISGNMRNQLLKASPRVVLIGRHELACSQLDWGQYRRTQTAVCLERRQLRDYQAEAVQSVLTGFKEHERGKLIMACGTGKTFTALKIAEQQAGAGGMVLVAVPSLALLSQTLTDWKQQSAVPITAFAVCSDVSVGKNNRSGKKNDEAAPADTEITSPLPQPIMARRLAALVLVIFCLSSSALIIMNACSGKGMPKVYRIPFPEYTAGQLNLISALSSGSELREFAECRSF